MSCHTGHVTIIPPLDWAHYRKGVVNMEAGWRQLKVWVLSCVVVATMVAACTTEAATTTRSLADARQSQPTAAAAITELWVDPVHGSDDHSGASAEDALATISAAWAQIPSDSALSDHGYRIQLLPGDYGESIFLAVASNSPSTLTIPDFDDWQGPAPVGALDNEVGYDYAKQPRASGGHPGAFAGGGEAPAAGVLLFLPGLVNGSPTCSR